MNAGRAERPTECATVAAAMVLAADDELSKAEWLVVETHLDQCAVCRAQWANLAVTDRRLLECAAELNALSPSGSALRARLMTALCERERRRWPGWIPRPGKWGWAAVSLATLSLAAVAAWTIITPLNIEHGRPGPSGFGAPSFAPADTPPGSAEVVRLQLSVAPVGDPFLDASQSESLVLADVAVGSDGQPTGMRLAE
jgi:predicted anti-sigma-YlaC factor YlaD